MIWLNNWNEPPIYNPGIYLYYQKIVRYIVDYIEEIA